MYVHSLELSVEVLIVPGVPPILSAGILTRTNNCSMHWLAGQNLIITSPSGIDFTCTMWQGVPLVYYTAGGDTKAKPTGAALMDVEAGQATQNLFQDTQPDPLAGNSETPAAEAANDTSEPSGGRPQAKAKAKAKLQSLKASWVSATNIHSKLPKWEKERKQEAAIQIMNTRNDYLSYEKLCKASGTI